MGRENREVTMIEGQIQEFELSNQERQNEVIQPSHHPGSISFCHTGVVFMQSDVSAVMEAILNAPI